MVPKLIGTKELENQQHIGQTPHKYVHIDMKMNFMHISSNLRLGGVSPIYWVKERKHAKETTRSKYVCSRLSRTETKRQRNTKRRKDTKWINHHLEDIHKRYIKEWDIHWYPLNKGYQTPKREDGSKQTKLSTKFHDGTKYQKESGLPSTNTHLIRITRWAFYRK